MNAAEPSQLRLLLVIFWVFLRLGLTSFGGPIAHIGFLRGELVSRRRWLDDAAFSELVALCQFLPGPASSQVGFALGVLRSGGLLGGIAAWLGFTLPSALLMLAFAFGLGAFSGAMAAGVLQGLKWVAVAVIAHALWGMARNLTPDRPRVVVALCCAVLVTGWVSPLAQLAAICLGGLVGLLICRDLSRPAGKLDIVISRRMASAALALFGAMFLLLPLLSQLFPEQGLALFAGLYRVGALVFGGGHVVLPLLQTEVVGSGWLDNEAFLAGYALAQVVPGPLFSVAAYIGALLPPAGWWGAALALLAIFLPGLLLVYGVLPFWALLRARPRIQAAMAGANAAVVGILCAALFGPVWSGAVSSWLDLLVSLLGLTLLLCKCPPWLLVVVLVIAGMLLSGSFGELV